MKRFVLFLAFICCALSVSAQNMRRVEGEVKDYMGASVPNATLQVYGANKEYRTDANGKFSIDVPIHAFAITVFSEGYKAKFMEIDGTYMLFILRPDYTKEKKARLLAEKEAKAKAKAEEQVRITAQKDTEAKAKVEAERKAAEEKARIVAEKETVRIAAEKAKAEKQAQIAAQKEAKIKAKAEIEIEQDKLKEERLQARLELREELKKYKKYSGYRQLVDLSYSYCGVTDFLGVNYIGGYRFNPYIFLGVGTGLNFSLGTPDASKLDLSFCKPTTMNIPVYLHFKANCTKSNWSPYISVSAGGRISKKISQDIWVDTTQGARDGILHYNQSGILGELRFGVDRAISKKLSIYLGLGYRVESYLYTELDSRANINYGHKLLHGFSAHLGLSF